MNGIICCIGALTPIVLAGVFAFLFDNWLIKKTSQTTGGDRYDDIYRKSFGAYLVLVSIFWLFAVLALAYKVASNLLNGQLGASDLFWIFAVLAIGAFAIYVGGLGVKVFNGRGEDYGRAGLGLSLFVFGIFPSLFFWSLGIFTNQMSPSQIIMGGMLLFMMFLAGPAALIIGAVLIFSGLIKKKRPKQ